MDRSADRMYDIMRKESNRLKTFQMNPPWPKEYVDIKKLAKSGFFYAFKGDTVYCAFCRGQVCQWERDDDPMAEHARHFTTCPFIMGGDVGNEPLGEDPFPGPKRPRPYDVCGPFPNFPPNDPRNQIVQATNQTGFMVNSSFQDYPPINTQSQRSDINNDVEHQYQPNNPNYQGFQESRHPNQNGLDNQNCNSSSSPEHQCGICKICYSNQIELVFLPCSHSVSCLSCAQQLFNCPYCREVITTRIRLYMV